MKKFFSIFVGLVLSFVFASTTYAYDINMGNDVTGRAIVDTYNNFSIVDTNNPANADGVLVEFAYWASNTNPFKFLVLDTDKKVVWKSDLITPPTTGFNTYNLGTAVPVQSGWNVGFWFQNTGTIPFDYNGAADPAYYTPNINGEPALDATLSVEGMSERYYSFMAKGWLKSSVENPAGDADSDSILNIADICPTGTTTDNGAWLEKFGTNRWQYSNGDGGWGWYQNKPMGKGVNNPTYGYNLEYTYGCNGHQILDLLQAELGDVMNGHRKFGLSSSLLEEFHTNFADGNISGRWYIETVTVPANKETPTDSALALTNGVNYILNARGTASACWQSGCHITFDPEYTASDYPVFASWVDGVAAPYDSYGTDLLDLKVNNGYVNWGSYNPLHTYEVPFVGAGNKINFGVYDLAGSYFNDAGNLYVDIIANL